VEEYVWIAPPRNFYSSFFSNFLPLLLVDVSLMNKSIPPWMLVDCFVSLLSAYHLLFFISSKEEEEVRRSFPYFLV
jgi:hypothetical protein